MKRSVRVARSSAALVAAALTSPACAMDAAGACVPGDADGILGTRKTFEVMVDDAVFAPTILKAQNLTDVTLTLTNEGAAPHDFVIDCLPTPNEDGCPTESCFPKAAATAPVGPGESSTVRFLVPRVEGIYTFRSSVAGDAQKGQFIVQ
jgi:hypothetical protein